MDYGRLDHSHYPPARDAAVVNLWNGNDKLATYKEGQMISAYTGDFITKNCQTWESKASCSGQDLPSLQLFHR